MKKIILMSIVLATVLLGGQSSSPGGAAALGRASEGGARVVVDVVGGSSSEPEAPVRLAVIESSTGRVVNIIKAALSWAPPSGYYTVPAGSASVKDTWNGTAFAPYQPTAEEVAAETLRAQDEATIRETLLEKGRLALDNWSTLTAAQKDSILKALLVYVLREESR